MQGRWQKSIKIKKALPKSTSKGALFLERAVSAETVRLRNFPQLVSADLGGGQRSTDPSARSGATQPIQHSLSTARDSSSGQKHAILEPAPQRRAAADRGTLGIGD